MKKTTMKEMSDLIYSMDKRNSFGNPDQFIKDNATAYEFKIRDFLQNVVEHKAVIGFDVYGYSRYKEVPQALIPFLLRELIQRAVDKINKYETFLFSGAFKLTKENFIDTGDGGFVLFDTPLHAICFSIHLSIALKQFNTYVALPLSRDLVKEIDIRFALTYDDVFFLEDNVYGAAIINNARILSKDKLNRFLFDRNTNEWFLKNMNGIEIIRNLNYSGLYKNHAFSGYKEPVEPQDEWGVFSKKFRSGLLSFGMSECNTQKIGVIQAKQQEISIFSLQLQFSLSVNDESDKSIFEPLVVTVGSLNSSGLVE